MPDVSKVFDPGAGERIRAAVAAAEGKTAGEIVPYAVDASDSYDEALWKGATIGALAASLATAAVHPALAPWGGALWAWLALPALLGAAIGYGAVLALPALRRALVAEDTLERRARRRAALAFLEEEVFRTRDRTGILLFVSLFEHKVVILGDEGIDAKVGQEEWDELAAGLAAGIRDGRAAAALIEAIEHCGDLLERRGVELKPDDTDELSDELRRRDR